MAAGAGCQYFAAALANPSARTKFKTRRVASYTQLYLSTIRRFSILI
jgi:hypothetical protein